MPRRNYDLLEIIRKKASWSQQIVKTKDPDYAFYSGASYEIASKMAALDTFLKLNFFPKEAIPLIKLYREYLNQQRKAFFASVGSTELTKLGFILGMADEAISAI